MPSESFLDQVFSSLNTQIEQAENGVFRWGYVKGGSGTSVTTIDASTVSPVINADRKAQGVLDQIKQDNTAPDSITKAPFLIVIACVIAAVIFLTRK